MVSFMNESFLQPADVQQMFAATKSATLTSERRAVLGRFPSGLVSFLVSVVVVVAVLPA